EPICRVLPIAPSTYHAHAAGRADPARLSARARRDDALKPEVQRVFEENFRVYGVRKVCRQLKREGHDVARCTVARLMQTLGLQGVIRGKPVRTTISDKATPCPLDHVNRQFKAAHPNALWLSDFTYVATWAGFVYVAFVIDAYARRIVGWRVSRTAHAGFVLDARELALDADAHEVGVLAIVLRPLVDLGLVGHGDGARIDPSALPAMAKAAAGEAFAEAACIARGIAEHRPEELGAGIGQRALDGVPHRIGDGRGLVEQGEGAPALV